jgi:SET domain-containing protein
MKKNILFHNNKIEVRKSKIHGWGVFAKEIIYAEEILEEIPFLIIPMSKYESSSIFIDYRFNYPRINSEYQVMPFGYAGLYNHSNNNNAVWETDNENELFIFKSIKQINKDDEILIYYGDTNYWNDGRKGTKVI